MSEYSFREIVIDSRTGLNPRKNFVLGQGENYYITIKDIRDGQVVFSDKTDRIDDNAVAIIKKRSRIKNGDVLFVSIGRIGETAVVRNKDDSWEVNESVFVFTLDTSIIDADYFCHLMRSRSVQERLKRDSSGSTFKSIKMNQLEKMTFEIPKLEEQKTIVRRLAKVAEQIEICNALIEKLDFSIKARFIEMFGSPSSNPMGWDIINISEVLDGKVSNGFFAKRDEYCDGGNVAVLGVANIVNRMYSSIDNLPTTNGTSKDIEKYHVKYGDMLFCRSSLVAEGIGKASVVPESVPDNVLFECHVIRLPLDLSKVVPEYLQVLSTDSFFRNQVLQHAKTATMTTIGQNGILATNILLPPVEEQKEFLSFIKMVNASKAVIQGIANKLNTLQTSLMQQFFG